MYLAVDILVAFQIFAWCRTKYRDKYAFLSLQALTENPALQFVKAQWIWQCCDKKKLVPHQPYLIVP